MRQLAMRGGPYTAAERLALLDYCQSDVDALARLLPAMLPQIDLPRALLRGRYMAAAARMEWTGVPIDADALARLRESWERIKARLIAAVDRDYGVFVPADQRTINPESPSAPPSWRRPTSGASTRTGWPTPWITSGSEEREANGEVCRGRSRKARQATGLTVSRIDQWEDAGHDYASYPGLDVTARELAGEYPALGIGPGYTAEDGYDDTDYAGRLWDLLRGTDDEPSRRSMTPTCLREAAEMVASTPDAERTASGPMRFSAERWAAYLARKGIPWPRLESGALALDDDTFREMARAYPAEVGPIRELRHALSQLRLNELAVGTDGRNRCLLSAFGSRDRPQPTEQRQFIFGPSAWLRSLIRPEPGPGRGLRRLVRAGVGHCRRPVRRPAHAGGLPVRRPLLWLRQACRRRAARRHEEDARREREQFKVVALGVLYGLSAEGLARKLNVPPCHGRELLRMHQQTFRAFWDWSDQIEMRRRCSPAACGPCSAGRFTSAATRTRGSSATSRCRRNGAEMMRLACCLATERGIAVCCPVHDALLVEGPADGIVRSSRRPPGDAGGDRVGPAGFPAPDRCQDRPPPGPLHGRARAGCGTRMGAAGDRHP